MAVTFRGITYDSSEKCYESWKRSFTSPQKANDWYLLRADVADNLAIIDGCYPVTGKLTPEYFSRHNARYQVLNEAQAVARLSPLFRRIDYIAQNKLCNGLARLAESDSLSTMAWENIIFGSFPVAGGFFSALVAKSRGVFTPANLTSLSTTVKEMGRSVPVMAAIGLLVGASFALCANLVYMPDDEMQIDVLTQHGL